MELQLDRREREEQRLRLELDVAQQALNWAKISKLQIQAEVKTFIRYFINQSNRTIFCS